MTVTIHDLYLKTFFNCPLFLSFHVVTDVYVCSIVKKNYYKSKNSEQRKQLRSVIWNIISLLFEKKGTYYSEWWTEYI